MKISSTPDGSPLKYQSFISSGPFTWRGRCIDCGLCEEACPMDIPLRLLYRKVNQIVSDVFEYDTGSNPELPPFSMLGDKVTLTPQPLAETTETPGDNHEL